MARETRRGMGRRTPATIPSMRAQAPPPDPQTSGEGLKIDRTEAERDERLRSALEWDGFESWCASMGWRSPSATREAIGLIAAYITFLAVHGRHLGAVARAILRARGDRNG